MKRITRVMTGVLATALILSAPINANAATLKGANLTEDSRGYGGNGNQDKNRKEDTITVRVSVGGGDSDWETGDFSGYYVYKNNKDEAMDQYELSFGDIDSDGDIDMTDMFNKLEEYKAEDTCGLSYSTSDYGDFYEDVFGISTGGSLTYKVNNIFCQAGTPDLYDGDSIVVLIMTGESNQWSEIDDSDYDYAEPQNNPNNVSTDWFEDENNSENTSGSDGYSKYINLMKKNLNSSFLEDTSLSDGNCFWQEMRILRNNDLNDEVYKSKIEYFDKYHQAKREEAENGKLKAVNAMRDASVTGDEQMLDYLAHGYNEKDAFTWDKTAGMYAVDYILMCLDNEGYAKDEKMAVSLSDYAESESVRDDLIKYIVDTDGCWGGGWFTYDTGAQNAQAIIPYYDMYPEVRDRVDTFMEAAMEKFRADQSTPESFDASSSSEVSRALCLLYIKTGDEKYLNDALELYNMVVDMGLENTKFHGNAMDVWRMALNEWGLNQAKAGNSGPNIEVLKNGFEMYYDTTTLGNNMALHIRSNEEISDMTLYELIIKIPDGLSVVDVTSPIVEEVEYHLDGDKLRIVLANLGSTLNVSKSTDVVKVDLKTAISGTVKCTVESIYGYVNSETKKIIEVKSEPVDIVKPYSVSAKALYKGNESSRFVDKDSKVEKITFGGKINVDGDVVINVDGKTYDMYESKDLSSESASVFLAYIPISITEEQLSEIDAYEVVKEAEKKTVTIGDVDNNDEVDVMDALHVIRLWVGKENIDANRTLISANVDGDSDITNADTLAIVEKKINSKQFKVLR